jgi:hypothetical protein
MNPFSGFLQPPQQRSPLAGAGEFVNDLSRLQLSRQQEANRVKEAATDNARADQYLKLQQTDQANRFTQQDQKQVEALLAEYQDAEDQGDQVRLSRAAQQLKRFGMDVSQKAPPSLPGQLPSPASLQQKDLSQAEFEEQLISSGQEAPSRYEVDGKTTPEFLKQIGSGPVDMGDVDSPEFRAAAAAEARPELANTEKQAPPRLPGQLPVVVSRGGKTLYESTGPSGRWTPMVQGVFQPLLANDNPDIALAAQRGQQIATKLIEVDGVAPKDAIKMGMDYVQQEATRLTNLERTKLGSKPRGGPGVPSGILGPKEDRAESIDKYGDNIQQAIQHAGIPASNEKLTAAESAIMSDDPALQKDALKLLLQARSGLTVSEGERRSYSGVDGLLPLAQNTLLGWAGKPMSPVTRQSLLKIIQNMRQVNAQTIERITAREKRRYLAQNEDKVAPERLEKRAKALAGEEDNSDLYR